MEEANYSFLVDNVLPQLGFNEILDEQLRTAMKLGLDKINLKVQDKQPTGVFTYNLVLEKDKRELDDPTMERRYYANRVEVAYHMNGEESPREHIFGLYKQKGLPVSQMRNLMKGNYVHNSYWKDGQEVKRWQFIDFNSPKVEGSYPMRSIFADRLQWNLAKELSSLDHVNSLTQDAKEDLLRALRNGDNVHVSLKINNTKQQVAIRANPKRAAIEIFSPDGLKVKTHKSSMSVIKEEQRSNLKEAASLVTDDLGEKNTSKKKLSRS